MDVVVADQVSSYWVNFATNGNPNGEGLPAWPAYDEQNVRFISLGDPVEPRALTDQPRLDFFEAYLAK